MMNHGFTDIHQHVLYGLDDGPDSPEKMHQMLRRDAEQGITRLLATPHVTPGVYPFDWEKYRMLLAEAQSFADSENLGIKLYEGAEILYTDQAGRFLQEGRIPTLAGTDRVLVEFSPDIRYEKLREALDRLLCCGYVPVVAHVERYECLTRHCSRMFELREHYEVFFQMNCQTVIHCEGFFKNRFVRKMLQADMIDALGTDAHNITSRPARMQEAFAVLSGQYGEETAHRLTSGSIVLD